MNKLLIISPRFPPTNAADLHRVRMSLPYYRRFGWEPTILCLSPDTCDGVQDALLGESLPKDIKIERVSAWSEEKCRRFGFGHVDYRCFIPLYRAGSKLLGKGNYDVVFFSTTVFMTFLLGPVWKRRFGCKIVYDFQDPWFCGSLDKYTKENVPGRWRKYRLSQFLARYWERFALRGADHVICVSDGYAKTLSKRYQWLGISKFTTIPFGVAKEDFEFVRSHQVVTDLIPGAGSTKKWVYAGRGGPDMDPILRVLFNQLNALTKKDPSVRQEIRLHFIGTNYSPADRTTDVIKPIANSCGVGSMVNEWSLRRPYHEALSLYSQSDAIMIIGSIDADYTPSKFFNCVQTGKPILALFHEDSFVAKIADRFPNVFVARFASDPSEPSFAGSVALGIEWLRNHKNDDSKVDKALKPWCAEALTSRQCSIFDRVCDG